MKGLSIHLGVWKMLPHLPDCCGAQYSLIAKIKQPNKQNLLKVFSFAFDFAHVHQEDDVVPTDGCQADWSRLQPQNLKKNSQEFVCGCGKMAGIPCKHKLF